MARPYALPNMMEAETDSWLCVGNRRLSFFHINSFYSLSVHNDMTRNFNIYHGDCLQK